MCVLVFHMSFVLRLVCVAIFPVELVLRCVARVRCACAFCVRVCESRMHAQCFRSRARVPVLLLCCDGIVRYWVLLDSETLIRLSHVFSLWQSERFVLQMLELVFGVYVRQKDSCHI